MSRQNLINGETYLSHRNKVNRNFTDVFHIESGGEVIYCEVGFVPAVNSFSDGSRPSPYTNLDDANNNVVVGDLGGAIVISPGTYTHAGVFDATQDVSFINPHGRGQVVFNLNFVQTDTNSRYQGIQFSQNNPLNIFGQSTPITFIATQCDFFGASVFIGSDTGLDGFVYIDGIFGAGTARSFRFEGIGHIFDSPFFVDQSVVTFGTDEVTDAPGHFFKITNGLFNSEGPNPPTTISRVQAEPGKQTTIVFFGTEFTTPILFEPGTGTILCEMDTLSYDEAIQAGTDFDVPGLTLSVQGRARFRYSETIINSNITNDPLQDVCELVSTGLVVGALYTLQLDMAWVLPSTTQSLFWQIEIDGLPFGPTFELEGKDAGNTHSWSYKLPVEPLIATSTVTLVAQTSGNQDATIQDVNIMLERKLETPNP